MEHNEYKKFEDLDYYDVFQCVNDSEIYIKSFNPTEENPKTSLGVMP